MTTNTRIRTAAACQAAAWLCLTVALAVGIQPTFGFIMFMLSTISFSEYLRTVPS